MRASWLAACFSRKILRFVRKNLKVILVCNLISHRFYPKLTYFKVTHLKEKAKQNYYCILISNNKNPSETRKNIRPTMILHKKQATTTLLDVVEVDENLINDLVEICPELNLHFL